MANLLYRGYKTGCYVGWNSSAGDYEYGSYAYGYSVTMASYYADLEPNTTYTIQRIDTSTRFRIALSQYDLKTLKSDSGTAYDGFTWGYRADSSNPITFTTGDGNTHLVVYYTNNSEYNTRVMLNEGNSIEPYEEPTVDLPTATWSLNENNKLVYGVLPEPIENTFSAPYPASFWRLDSNYILTLNSEDWAPFPESMNYLTPPYPATMWYLDKDNKLMNALLPDELITGAFMNCIALKDVSIPKSVKHIGKYAFYNTALKSVRISKDCIYYPTSFPPGCAINFYDAM